LLTRVGKNFKDLSMKILLVHNAYRHRGGEESVVAAEHALLVDAGHRVATYSRYNEDIVLNGLVSRVRLAARTIWAYDSYNAVSALLREQRPDVVNFHNIFPLISPSVYHACAKTKVPVVQTLHNYRLVCPGGMLLRDGRVCEKCVGQTIPWQGIRHACYRGSRAASSVVSAMLATHHMLSTWKNRVSVYVALTRFAQGKFVAGGIPAERILVKPNFVSPDPGVGTHTGDYALFVGRLFEEKGVRVLMASWSLLQTSIPLKIAGDGPLRQEMESLVAQRDYKNVSLLGRLPRKDIHFLMRSARFLVFPSIWFEGFPLTIAESFACGVPVIVPSHGSTREIVRDGQTGLHFAPADADDLAAKVEWAWNHPDAMQEMGRSARLEFEAKYTAGRNYEMLMNIYEKAKAISV
jgi:glycosyltransferase involved in cell wall biosynthesis